LEKEERIKRLALCENSDTTGFGRVVFQFLLTLHHRRRLKLNLRTTKVGGIQKIIRPAHLSRLMLKYHAAEAGGIGVSSHSS
jgi:hypothetical protein